MFSGFPPSAKMRRAIVVLEAPAPNKTILQSSIFLPANFSAFKSPARVIQAVPCASSCQTGISQTSRKVSKTLKHSGCLMSSRLTAPTEGANILTKSIILSGSFFPTATDVFPFSSSRTRESIHNGYASTPPRYFMSMHFPSITPKPPGGVQSPSPKTRVESLTTATRFPLFEREKDASLSSRIEVEMADTPGVYQTPNQSNP